MKFIKNDTGFDINDSNVKYIHLHWDRLLSNLGGATICYYLDFETKHIYFNYSNCASGDNFNKRIGRNIALGRLRQNYVQVSLEKEIKYKNCCEAIENYFLKQFFYFVSYLIKCKPIQIFFLLMDSQLQ